MKRTTARLSRRYAAGLRKYLKQGSRASLQPARGLGRKAMALGLETLDLARIHEVAMVKLALPRHSPRAQRGTIKRAEAFFVEAITPIEATHRAAQETNSDLNRLTKTLNQRSAELNTSDRHLKQGIVQRKAAEEALKRSGKHRTDLLEQSRLVQEHLRQLTRQILSAHEDKRTTISRKLHDEIAQALLGINVRLLALKNEATVNSKGLKKEIANTRRLVEKSKKILSRFVEEIGI